MKSIAENEVTNSWTSCILTHVSWCSTGVQCAQFSSRFQALNPCMRHVQCAGTSFYLQMGFLASEFGFDPGVPWIKLSWQGIFCKHSLRGMDRTLQKADSSEGKSTLPSTNEAKSLHPGGQVPRNVEGLLSHPNFSPVHWPALLLRARLSANVLWGAYWG